MAAILLELHLTFGLVEDTGSHPVERALTRRRLGLRIAVDRLASAARDPRVVGSRAKLGASSMSLAQAQELSDAGARFRANGKRTIAWAETFGELGGGQTAYVLAVAFDEVWLQPSGSVGLMGVSMTGVFLRGVLDRAHIEPLLAQRHEYKGAAERPTRTGFTPAGRDATERLAASRFEQIVSAVLNGRRLPQGRVRELIDRAPIPAAEAREAGLAITSDIETLFDGRLIANGRRRGELCSIRPGIAPRGGRLSFEHDRAATWGRVIEATGAIRTGHSRRGPVGRAAGSDTVSAAFRSAVRDECTKASCSESTVPADRTSPRTPSGMRYASLVRPARWSSCRRATCSVRAATSSAWQPTLLWRSRDTHRFDRGGGRQAPGQRAARAAGCQRGESRRRTPRPDVLDADRLQRRRVGQAPRMARSRSTWTSSTRSPVVVP